MTRSPLQIETAATLVRMAAQLDEAGLQAVHLTRTIAGLRREIDEAARLLAASAQCREVRS